MATFFENGIVSSATSADTFIKEDVYMTGAIRWVDSVTGNSGNPGTELLPLDTLANAVTASAASGNDIIIIKAGHTETVGSAITIDKASLKIFGCGTGTSKPSFTCNFAGDCIDVTAGDVELNNLRFPVGTTANNTARINIGNSVNDVKVKSCDFLCGVRDIDTITLGDGAGHIIENCTFTISADGPDRGIIFESADSTAVTIKDCTFDGGSFGWDDAAIYANVAHTIWHYDNITLTSGATVLHTQNSIGLISRPTIGAGCWIRPNSLAGAGVVRYFKNGLVSSTTNADALLTNELISVGYSVYWVDSVNGSASNAGSEAEPFASIENVLDVGANNILCIVKANSTFAPSSTITINRTNFHIYGLGAASARPTFTPATGASFVFDLTAANAVFSNLIFNDGTAVTAVIRTQSSANSFRNCEFNPGADTPICLQLHTGSGDIRVESCVFNMSADGPDYGIKATNASGATNIRVTDTSFESTPTKWATAAMGGTTALSFMCQNITLIGESDLGLSDNTNKGFISNLIASANNSLQA